MKVPTDETLRRAGAYDPRAGMGSPSDPDHGNFSGSVLMLAMLNPERYGVTGAEPLQIFGAETSSLLQLGTAPCRSGHGADNRRTNAIEALLNHLAHQEQSNDLRNAIFRTWRLVRMALATRERKFWGRSVQEEAKALIACADNTLPSDDVTNEELASYETLVKNLSEDALRALAELPSGAVAKSQIAEVVKLSKDSKTVGILHRALRDCGDVEHRGDLHMLLFAHCRAAASGEARQ